MVEAGDVGKGHIQLVGDGALTAHRRGVPTRTEQILAVEHPRPREAFPRAAVIAELRPLGASTFFGERQVVADEHADRR